MIVGLYGVGKMTTFVDVGFPKMELRVGGNTAGWNTLFAAGSTVTAFDCQIGGVAFFGSEVGVYNVQTNLPGYGEMILSNTTLKIAADLPVNTDGQFRIGRYAGGYGILRGCGVVQGSSYGDNTIRIWMNEGQIIADGFGTEAALDLNTVVSIRNNSADIAADTTNGWYAVNKGAALFPRAWFNSASMTTVIGGWNQDTNPGFVNSVGVSVSGVSGSNRYLRGGVFSADRSDVHADVLPRNAGVIGIWKVGITDSVTGNSTLGYTSASLNFRYDQSKVRDSDTLVLCRWNGSSWVAIESKAADSTYKIAVSGLSAPASWDGIYNVGTFALLRRTAGFTILVK